MPRDQKDERTLLGGGMALPPVRHILRAEHFAEPGDGIGRWTDADFVTAMTKGTSPAGRHYFPAFPYTSYAKMSVDDVRDLFAYLKTLPQAAGKVRDHDVPFPFNIRRNVGGWKFLFFDDKPFVADAEVRPSGTAAPISSTVRATAPNVTARAMRLEASSPRSGLPADRTRKARAGFPTSRRRACRSSRKGSRRIFSRPAMTPKASVSGSMGRVIKKWRSSTPADRKAMAVYLKSLPPVEGPKQARGKILIFCRVKNRDGAPHAGMRLAGFSRSGFAACLLVPSDSRGGFSRTTPRNDRIHPRDFAHCRRHEAYRGVSVRRDGGAGALSRRSLSGRPGDFFSRVFAFLPILIFYAALGELSRPGRRSVFRPRQRGTLSIASSFCYFARWRGCRSSTSRRSRS